MLPLLRRLSGPASLRRTSCDRRRRSPPNRFPCPILWPGMLTRDEIIWGYRYLLGRDPQPGEVRRLESEAMTCLQLRLLLLNSDEFAAQEKVIGHVSKWVITEIFDGGAKIWVDL